MKKFIALLLALLMVFSMVACGSKEEAPAEEAEVETEAPAEEGVATFVREYPDREQLSFWFWGASTEYQEVMKKVLCDWYNESQDKYELVLEFRNNVDTDIPVALAAGQGPDIVYCSGPSYTATYAQEGLVIDMTPYAEQYGWEDRILSVMYDACKVDGKLYSLPGGMLIGGLMYNKDLFAENGWEVPTTVEELEATMDAANEAGVYPLSAGARGWKPCNDHYSGMMFGSFMEPSILHDALTGEIEFTDSRIVETVKKTAEWYQAGYLSGNDYPNIGSSESMQALGQGKAAMAIVPTLYFQWVDPADADKIGFTTMPNTYTDENVYLVSMASNYGINANSPAPDECAKILDYMMTAEFTMEMNKGWPAYWTLGLKDCVDLDLSVLEDGIGKTCFQAVQDAIPAIDAGYFAYHPATFFPAATVTAFEDIDTVWQGVMTAEDFCEVVGREITSDIENNLVCPLAEPAV